MAVTTICSSPAHSTTLPAISSLKTHQPLQPHIPVSSFSSTKFGTNLVSNDALLLAGAAQAVALARAAVQAAKEAVLAAAETGEVWSGRESGNGLVKDGCDGGIRRRRRRRKGVEEKNGVSWRISRGSVKSRYLSPGEEVELCLCLKEGARLEEARTRITKVQGREPTSKQLAKDLGMKQSVDKILCDGRESRERIAQSYRRLVVSIAKGYQGKGLSFRDLIQEGCIGLLRGVEKFEPERGHKLSTYVYWWIKQAIIKAVASESRIIRLPGHVCRMVARIAEASNLLSEKLGRLPTHDEVAEVLDVHISTVRLVSQRSRPPISLDQPLSDRGHMTLQEIIRGSDETTPENMVKKQLIKQEVEELLKTLDKREEHILRLHFGIDGEPPRSYEEIARQLKLSRERIRQINCTALSKLRRTSVADDLELYVV
ncbi:RNA polymerase sigma factor sigD, chloroplastic [Morella rubra]|uniref:RNA polymerase sigma factor sigD, chloroplastic n=2 Tax=Morella rubra TaxID=262757 RepID=A0A6A1WQB9_9ROSI|nr:RNA polymerase sigma factor sigD, chloroplastic [Morella rubra]